jgi:hypothetical protein
MMYVKANNDFYNHYRGVQGLERCYSITFDLTDKNTKDQLIIFIKNRHNIGIRESKDWLELQGTNEFLADYRVIAVKEKDRLTLWYSWMDEWIEGIEEITKGVGYNALFTVTANDKFRGNKGVGSVGIA